MNKPSLLIRLGFHPNITYSNLFDFFKPKGINLRSSMALFFILALLTSFMVTSSTDLKHGVKKVDVPVKLAPAQTQHNELIDIISAQRTVLEQQLEMIKAIKESQNELRLLLIENKGFIDKLKTENELLMAKSKTLERRLNDISSHKNEALDTLVTNVFN